MHNCGDTEILHIPASLEDYLQAQGHDLIQIVKNAYRLDDKLPPPSPTGGQERKFFGLRPGVKVEDLETKKVGYISTGEGPQTTFRAISDEDPSQIINIAYEDVCLLPESTYGRWYLGGPMAGYDGHNYEQFHSKTHFLRDLGFEIVSPAELHPDAPAFFANPELTEAERRAKRAACLQQDLIQLAGCRGIVLLQGWEHSKGTRLEFVAAVELGLDIMITW